MHLDKAPNTSVYIKGIEHLYFSGTSYLGVATLPDFQETIFKSIQKWGSSYGSSRNANLKLDIFKKGEEFLCNFLKSEDCLTVSSGTLAGLLSISALETVVDSFFYMPKTHPAILPKKATSVFKNNFLTPLLLNKKKETICIVTDAIATLETTPYNFDFLDEISTEKKVFLLIDESHSLGILGKNGNGVLSQFKKYKNIEIVRVSSLTKAYGVNGGIVSGTKKIINLLKNTPLFVGSAPMNPAFLESFIISHQLYINQLKKLQENCNYVFNRIHSLKKVRISKNYPVFFVDDQKIADFLISKKIIITSFYYPTLNHKKINRLVINANHTNENLNYLVNCLDSFFE